MPKLIEDCRETIIIIVLKEIEKKSFDEISMRDIAKKAGIGLGTFYNYFKNKEELVQNVLETYFLKYYGEHKEVLKKDIPIEDKINQYIDVFMENVFKSKDVTKIEKHKNIIPLIKAILKVEKNNIFYLVNEYKNKNNIDIRIREEYCLSFLGTILLSSIMEFDTKMLKETLYNILTLYH